MLNRYLTYYKPGMQMAIFLAVLSMTWFLAALAMEFVNQQLLGYDSATFHELKSIPDTLATPFKLTEIIALLLMLLLPAMLFAYLAYPQPLTYLRADRLAKPSYLLLGICIMLAALPFSGLLEDWSSHLKLNGETQEMDERYRMLAKLMLSGNTLGMLLFNIVAISIIPAIVEEIFFRGCLQNILLSWMPKYHMVALMIIAAVFSAFHGQLSGFFPRLFLGLLLGLGYYFTGNLWVGVVMHMINNLITVVMVYLYNTQHITIDVTQLPPVHVLVGLASLLVTGVLVYFLYKLRVQHQYIEVDKSDEELKFNNNE
jgi:membrane protease YdiL (CAAX protease family)